MARRPRPIRFRPIVTNLEDRAVPATHTWTDASPSTNNWSDPLNWAGGVPTSGESGGTIVVFAVADQSSTMNIPNLVVDQIKFTATGGTRITLDFSLTVDADQLNTNIASTAGNNSIVTNDNRALFLRGSADMFVDVSSGSKVTVGVNIINDVAVASTGGIKKLGTGTLELTGAINTYNGTTWVADGTLRVATTGAQGLGFQGVSESVLVGDGTGVGGTAVLDVTMISQIPDVAIVTVRSDGLLTLNGTGQRFKTLNMDGGTISLGTDGNFRITDGGSINCLASGSTIIGYGTTPYIELSESIPVTVNDGKTLTINCPIRAVNFQNPLTPRLIKQGEGTLITDNNTSLLSTARTRIAAGNMIMFGNQASTPVVLDGGHLSLVSGDFDTATTKVGTVTVNGGILDTWLDVSPIDPNTRPSSTKDLTLAGGTFLPRYKTTPTAGLTNRLAVTGTVSISGTTLSFVGDDLNAPPIGQAFTIIENDGTDPVTGFFANVAEGGTIVTSNGLTFSVTYHGGDGNDVVLTAVPPVPPPPPPAVLARETGVGQGTGGGTVKLYNPDATERFTATPFGAAFAGGIRTAAADFNHDGVADLVVGTGPGGPSHVRILDGTTQAELFALDPFEASFTGGVFVAAGDVTGDRVADLVITPDEGGGPRCRVFSGAGFGQIADFFGIDDPNFRGGARPAVGDLDGDGAADLVVAAGFGGGPRVAAFSGRSLGSTPVKLFGDFLAFEPELRNGTFVAAGDVDGDGKAELVAGGGPGGGPRVTVFDGADLLGNVQTRSTDFFAGDVTNRGGVRLAVKNLDGDARADLVAGAGTGAGSRVTAYAGASLTGGSPPELAALDAFPGFAGGVFVG